jgi:hypothetical protein
MIPKMKRPGQKFNFPVPLLFGLIVFSFGMEACFNSEKSNINESKKGEETSFTRLGGDFNVDSAFAYSKKQVDFGPRIPGTPAHEKCAEYLLDKLKSFGLTAYFQEGSTKVYTGKTYTLKNIIGSFHPENPTRVLLSAHWDTRPFSDQETDPKLALKTFDGANDGASGVGILLELAREISLKNPKIGVDIIFWDIEDYGMKNDGEDEKTWCLGSRYWVANPPVKGYNPLYNINLDMVGGVGAVFNMENISMKDDGKLVKQIWDLGNSLGYSQYFSYTPLTGPIIDDHVVVNNGSNIPAIDIIDFNDQTGFYKYWHKQGDDLSHLDKNVMKAVGQTVLENVYQEGKSNKGI